jgi:hypothetical protein
MDEGRKRFFFEKKKQKTSVHWYPDKPTGLQGEKFFASFLQKRSASLL